MTAAEFTGHIRAMRADTDWYGAEDFVDLGQVPLRIERVEFDANLKIGGSVSKDKYYLVLTDIDGKPCKKKMSINAGRRKMLGAMYGGKVEAWKGKWVWVYADTVKAIGGGETLGMKFANKKDVPEKKASASKPEPLTEEEIELIVSIEQNVENCESLEALKDIWKKVESLRKPIRDKLTSTVNKRKAELTQG